MQCRKDTNALIHLDFLDASSEHKLVLGTCKQKHEIGSALPQVELTVKCPGCGKVPRSSIEFLCSLALSPNASLMLLSSCSGFKTWGSNNALGRGCDSILALGQFTDEATPMVLNICALQSKRRRNEEGGIWQQCVSHTKERVAAVQELLGGMGLVEPEGYAPAREHYLLKKWCSLFREASAAS